MKLSSESFADGARIPGEYALGVPDPEQHVRFGGNRNPHLRWNDAPQGTRSFALICVDRDAPTSGEDVNKEGRTVPHDLRRGDFYHWALANVPASVTEIPAGAVSEGVTERGKPTGESRYGRSGINDYTGWFAGDENMEGQYGGYDGPCPPWNDERVHRYHFTVYALDTDRVDLPDPFTATDLLDAIEGHVLDSASIVGTYSFRE